MHFSWLFSLPFENETLGGSSAFASALMLGPRLGRYADGIDPLPLGNPVNACMGLFVLWWGWLAFNSGSTYGVSGAKWQYAARAAVMTMMGCKFFCIYIMKNNYTLTQYTIMASSLWWRLLQSNVSTYNLIFISPMKGKSIETSS